jgi:hypothetical protein
VIQGASAIGAGVVGTILANALSKPGEGDCSANGDEDYDKCLKAAASAGTAAWKAFCRTLQDPTYQAQCWSKATHGTTPMERENLCHYFYSD